MNDIIAAIDSSGKAAGVCILAGGQVLAQHTLNAGRTHSETLLPLLESSLAEAGLCFADVMLYALCGGPGSFTGLRIGMALIKGLALPGNTPAVAVSTLKALALAAAETAGLRGTVVSALDARRGEVYWAAFDATGPLKRLTEDATDPVTAIGGKLGFAPAPVFFVGDGAEICYTIYNYNKRVCRAGDFLPPIALGAARLAHQRLLAGQAGPAAALRPQYLRLSQAERQRQERLT